MTQKELIQTILSEINRRMNENRAAAKMYALNYGYFNANIAVLQDLAVFISSLPTEEEQKWSEVDEAMRNNILRCLQCFVGTAECESNPSLSTSYPLYMREIDWLKSLRPQKQEESENSEIIRAAIYAYEDWKGGTMDDVRKSMSRLGELVEPIRKRMYEQKPEPSCQTCTNDKGCVTCKDGELWEGGPAEFLSELSAEIDKVSRRYPEVSFAKLSRIAKHFYELGKGSQPQLPANLDEAADAYERSRGIVEVSDNEDCRRAFKAGAEWQAERLLKGSPMPEDTVLFKKGIEEGKRLMMEDAVEGFIFQSADYYPKQLIAGYDGELGMGDKVKIVIVKEDKE